MTGTSDQALGHTPAGQPGPVTALHPGRLDDPRGAGDGLAGQWYCAVLDLAAELQQRGLTAESLDVYLRDRAAWTADPLMGDTIYREVMGGPVPPFRLADWHAAGEDLAGLPADATVALRARTRAAVAASSAEPVYRGFTAAELNREYSPSSRVPERREIIRSWRQRGWAFARRRTAELRYGPTPRQAMDLYMPDPASLAGGRKPLLFIFIHGGYWQAIDKRDNGYLLQALVARGVAGVSLNYDLCPDVTIGDIAAQCRAALCYLRDHAADWGYDAGRMHVSGHSAGAHLAAMLGSDPAAPRLASLTLLSGLYDLEPLRLTGMNPVLRLDPATAHAWSPLYRRPQGNPAVILSVGEAESGEFHRQTALLATAWAPDAVIHHAAAPGDNHFTIIDRLADTGSALFRAVAGATGAV